MIIFLIYDIRKIELLYVKKKMELNYFFIIINKS